jgi:hypothetical protein
MCKTPHDALLLRRQGCRVESQYFGGPAALQLFFVTLVGICPELANG